MSIRHLTLAEANGHLAELIQAAERGDEVVIEGENKTQVKLVAVNRSARVLGAYRGKIHLREDFNAPLPDDFWLGGHP